MDLKSRIEADMKTALRAGDRDRLVTVRMLRAAIKQREVDERIDLDDAAVLQIVEKLVKQRREAATQYASAGRSDLERKELAEAEQLSAYLPEPLDDEALDALIDDAIAETGASSVRDMGRVMNTIRARAQGRADMGTVGARVKQRLST